ncbi:MAG: Stp1/IreP family PP2C-type Ser/Thr phosphatase [Clostridia bacterium]|nr:Stp1/IreP family PP2C-type Ser/Thr phosphatase [Clostridia bacterium]
MIISANTNIGLVRSENQDCFKTGTFDDGIVWCVVCDGMGGTAGGDIASKMAVDLISGRIENCFNSKMKPSSIGNLFESAINLANIEIFDLSKENPQYSGMGTTVVAAIADGEKVYISHAGDSRAYLLSDEGFRQVTVDHSVVQEMVDRGEISKEEAEHHPIKNYITRALGVGNSIVVDFNYFDFNKGDQLMICTDGLSNMVSIDEMQTILESDDDCVKALIDKAIDRGGKDNITVVIIKNEQ